MISRRTFVSATVAAGFALAAGPASAQSYPDKPIKMIVPFPPGGPIDTMARLVGVPLRSVVVAAVLISGAPSTRSRL